MQIIAHRGASGYQPENTIPAFKKALEMGSTSFETDVQRSKDGFLVIFHDYTLTDGRKIKDCTVEQLAKFNIPLVEDVLKTLGKDIKLNLEIKNDDNIYPGIERELMALLNSSPAAYKERILISSFDLDTLKRVRAIDKNIKIGRLTRAFDIKEALDLGAYSVNISLTRITPEIVQACHKENIKVLVYTVNDRQDAIRLQEMGVDAVFSDYPDIMSRKDNTAAE